MKKNWTMRVALLVVALTLITSCFVGGTFAKYVTGASYEDTARVAKFGVLLTVDGDGLFADKYEADDPTYVKSDYTVEAAATEEGAEATVTVNKLVAPGTPAGLKDNTVVEDPSTQAKADATGTESEGITFAIAGTPEVAVRIAFEFGETFKDVVLPKGTYTDYTKLIEKPATNGEGEGEGESEGDKREAAEAAYGYYGEFTLEEDYYPVVFTLTQTKGATDDAPVAEPITGSLTEIKEALAKLGADYAPNTVLDAEFTLTWAWAFEHGETPEEIALYDAADTYLGNVAAGVVKDAPEGVSVELAFDVTITVTQID